jgi:hypothetical protein
MREPHSVAYGSATCSGCPPTPHSCCSCHAYVTIASDIYTYTTPAASCHGQHDDQQTSMQPSVPAGSHHQCFSTRKDSIWVHPCTQQQTWCAVLSSSASHWACICQPHSNRSSVPGTTTSHMLCASKLPSAAGFQCRYTSSSTKTKQHHTRIHPCPLAQAPICITL